VLGQILDHGEKIELLVGKDRDLTITGSYVCFVREMSTVDFG
jgi:hypothetical protein